MRLCLNGEFKTIVVDDQFPVEKQSQKMAFSQCKGTELWVMLLEKAWAKINSSYENTILGCAYEAFKALTGAPIRFYDHDYKQDMWK